MKFYQMVGKDVMRRRRRVMFAVLGVVIGTMTVVGILTIAFAGQTRIYGQLEKYGPNLTIVPSISNLDMKLGDLSMGTLTVGENYIKQDQLPRIREIADTNIRQTLGITEPGDLATVAPKLYVTTKVKDVSLVVVGVDPEAENKIKTWWTVREGDFLDQPNQAMVGGLAAQLLKLKMRDTITLNGTDVTVGGILNETGSADDYQVFVPLATVQKAFGKEGIVSTVDVRALCNSCPVETIADAINKDIPGVRAVAVKQIAASEMGLVDKMSKFMLALGGITLAVGLFGVANTMTASVNERIKDIGIMRAVGASRNQIVRVFIYEAIIVGVIGGVFGYIIGTLLAQLTGPLIFEGTTVSAVLQYIPVSLGVATAVAVLATVYPSFRATRIRVADSFRSI